MNSKSCWKHQTTTKNYLKSAAVKKKFAELLFSYLSIMQRKNCSRVVLTLFKLKLRVNLAAVNISVSRSKTKNSHEQLFVYKIFSFHSSGTKSTEKNRVEFSLTFIVHFCRVIVFSAKDLMESPFIVTKAASPSLK